MHILCQRRGGECVIKLFGTHPAHTCSQHSSEQPKCFFVYEQQFEQANLGLLEICCCGKKANQLNPQTRMTGCCLDALDFGVFMNAHRISQYIKRIKLQNICCADTPGLSVAALQLKQQQSTAVGVLPAFKKQSLWTLLKCSKCLISFQVHVLCQCSQYHCLCGGCLFNNIIPMITIQPSPLRDETLIALLITLIVHQNRMSDISRQKRFCLYQQEMCKDQIMSKMLIISFKQPQLNNLGASLAFTSPPTTYPKCGRAKNR